MSDYSQGKIYKVTCETGKVYIGSTVRKLDYRFSQHKTNDNDCASKDFINPKIELIESYPCETKQQLLWREREWFEKTECVNKHRPIITDEEKIQYEKEAGKSWYQRNKGYIPAYRKKNKEKTDAYDKAYYEKIKHKRKEKITCECGKIVSKGNKPRHLKTKKHQAFVSSVKINL